MVTYTADAPIFSFLNSIYKVLEEFYDEREEYEKDTWALMALGIQSGQIRSLNFTGIHQPWLRDAGKKHVRHLISTHTPSTCVNKIKSLGHLSNFLKESHPSLRPEAFSRGVVEEFMAYLLRQKLHGNTRHHILGDIRQFHEDCVRFGWAPLPPQKLIFRSDFPGSTKPDPRHLPDDVVDGLLASLSGPGVPRELGRMVRIDLHTGMRVGDLLALKRNCLDQDSEGDYWIKFFIEKMKKDHALPIDREMAEIIREQQKEVADRWGNSTPLLFPNHKGEQRSDMAVVRAINEVVAANDIRKPDGTPYRFQFHPLRHTCGTRMTNAGYSQKVVQDWLAHESPEMTDRYAKLYDRTKKEAFKKYLLARGPLINIKGEVINLDSPVDGVEHQALKDQIKDRRLALPNGHCARPIPLGPCPHFNACYQCASFVTDRSFLAVHERDLQETNLALAKARQNGWQRHVEKHEADRKNLKKIIAKLKQEGLVGDAEP
jgi:integrase